MRQSQVLPHAQCPPAASNTAFLVRALGKRSRRGSAVTPGTFSTPTQTISAISSRPSYTTSEGSLSVYCRRLRRAFLVDSGADVSVFPASTSQKNTSSTSFLRAANGSSIKTYGTREIFLALPGLNVTHKFVLADVRQPILGSDFFLANNLLIDINKCLSLIHI